MKRHCYTIAILTALMLSACSGINREPADRSTGEPPVTEAVTEPIRIESETKSESESESTSASEPAEQEGDSALQPSGAEPSEEKKAENVPKETQAAKVYTVTALKKTMYVTQPVHVRASYTMQSDVLTSFAANRKVEVTGRSANGWMRIVYNGKDAYIYQKYLNESRSEAGTSQAAENTIAKNPDGSTGSQSSGNAAGGTAAGGSAPGGTAAGSGGSAAGAGSTADSGSTTAGPGGLSTIGGGSSSNGGQPAYGPSVNQNTEPILTVPTAPISGTSWTLMPGEVSGPGVSPARAVSGAAPGM